MHYKTIALELLKAQPDLYRQLRQKRMALLTMEAYVAELKASHERWKQTLARVKSDRHPIQSESEAMEPAIQGLQDRVQSMSLPNDSLPHPMTDVMDRLKG